jgi:hypothetical protein
MICYTVGLAVRILLATTRTFTKDRHCRSRAGARHGMCELMARHGRGTAWARHGHACYVWIGLKLFQLMNFMHPVISLGPYLIRPLDSVATKVYSVINPTFYNLTTLILSSHVCDLVQQLLCYLQILPLNICRLHVPRKYFLLFKDFVIFL